VTFGGVGGGCFDVAVPQKRVTCIIITTTPIFSFTFLFFEFFPQLSGTVFLYLVGDDSEGVHILSELIIHALCCVETPI
jgi:hypothetical protein